MAKLTIRLSRKQARQEDVTHTLNARDAFCLECGKVYAGGFYSDFTGMDREALGKHDSHHLVLLDGSNKINIVVVGG